MDTKNQNVRVSNVIIGQGSYGVVHKGYIKDEIECAIKVTHPILAESDPGLINKMVSHEADIMQELSNHPNLVQFKCLYYPPSSKHGADYPYIVMELCHRGNLQSCLQKDTLNLQMKLSILHDIAKGLEYMHSNGFIHCDLSPNNILLTESFNAKIGDFGVTKQGKNFTDLAPGRLGYMGPEAKGSVSSYGKKLDIYSFGCIVLFTITGKECTDSIEEWLKLISPWPLLKKLAKECLQDDPQKRPTAGEICEQLHSMQQIIDEDMKTAQKDCAVVTDPEEMHTDLHVGTACTASMEDMAPGKHLNTWKDHKQAGDAHESVLEDTNCIGMFTNSAFAKLCTILSIICYGVAVAFLEPLLYTQPFSKQKCKPHVLVEDGLTIPSEVQIGCTETEEHKLSTLQDIKHESHNKSNNRIALVENDGGLFDTRSLKSNTRPNIGMKYSPLTISRFSIYLLLMFSLQSYFPSIESFSVNGLNNSMRISPRCLYVINESALPQAFNEVKYCNNSKILLHNLDNDSFANYTKRLSYKEKDMEHLKFERYATVNLFVQYPILFPHHTQQIVNASEYNVSDPSVVVVVEEDDASSSIWQLTFLNGMVYDHLHPSKNLHSTQNTNMTLSINSFISDDHLLHKSGTMHNQTSFTGHGCRWMDSVIKTELLTTTHAMPDSCMVHNDTCSYLSYGKAENHTYMVMNFYTLVDEIVSIPLDVISMVSLPSIYIDKPLLHCINNNSVATLNTYSPNIEIKFMGMTLQYHLLNSFVSLTFCIYISTKLLTLALNSIKLNLQNQRCTLHLNKSIRGFICGNTIYCLKNSTNFCNMNQHLSICSCKHQQQLVTTDLTKHRHFSDIWCTACQENLFGPCNMFIFRGMLHKKSTSEILFYDICWVSNIIYGKLITVSIFYTSLPMTIINTKLKNFMKLCGNSPEALVLTNHIHGGTILADSLVQNKPTKLLDNALYTCPEHMHYNENPNVKKTRRTALILYYPYPINLQKILYRITQPEANKVTPAMNTVNNYFRQEKHDSHCGNVRHVDNNQNEDNHHDGDHYNNHSANQNNDTHDDHDDNAHDHNDDDDHNGNDGGYGASSDRDHDDDDDDDGDDDNDNYGHDQNFIEFVLIYLLLLLIMLLSFRHLFLVSYHIFIWQVLKYISYAPRLSNRCAKVACIGNKSYHNTFRPNSRLTLVRVLNTNITSDVIQRNLAYNFRRRYSQCAILYDKLLINFTFQASPLCCYSTANFQTRFVNMIIHYLQHCQDNVPIMLLNSGEQFQLLFLSTQRKQKLVLLWQRLLSHFHKISVLILCEVKDESCFNIIAMTFQNANNTTNVFNGAIPLLSLRILDTQLHMPTCNVQVIKVQSSMRQIKLNITIVNKKQITLSTNYSMMWFKHVCEGETVDAVKLVTVCDITVYKLTCDLHQDGSCFRQHNDSMLCFSGNNHGNVHLPMEILFRILFTRLEMHLFVNTYHFLRDLTHEDVESHRIIAIDFLSALLTTGYGTHSRQLLRCDYTQTSLSDSPVDRAGVVKMVLECTYEGLRETMKHGWGIQLVTAHVTHNICIYQPAQRESALDSAPAGHGGNTVIKGNHVSRFLSVNPPPRHLVILPQADICNQDMKVS